MEEPSEDDDLAKVFNICDTDGDGQLTKQELELILQDIGVEDEDISEFMRGLHSEELINFTQFVDAIEKFRSHTANFIQSVNSNRASPRSLAGSALGGDHSDCNFAIHELQSRNSVLSKQVFALEAQIHEFTLVHEDQQKSGKSQSKELRKLQAKYSEVSAELEAAKQANKDMLAREGDLKRSLRQLQEQRGDIEDTLNSARAELESARSSGSTPGAVSRTPRIHPSTQAELDRLHESLDRSENETTQLRRINDELTRLNSEHKFHIKILDARIDKLNLELEAKDVLFAELGLVPDKQGGVTDMQGKTWHGFRNVSPLYSELGQVHDQPLHPSLIDARSLPSKPGFDSGFLKEKVANVNEEIRRRGASDRKRPPLGSVTSNSDEPGGETDTSFSVSENEDTLSRIDRMMDDHDLVTNQLMNLSDLLITTSDIAHSNRATPTHIDRNSTTSTPLPVSETSDTSDGNTGSSGAQARKDRVIDASASLANGSQVASPVTRANTPTPTNGYGPSPDEAHHNLIHVHDSPPSSSLDSSFRPNETSPRAAQSQPTTPYVSSTKPSQVTPRASSNADSETSPNSETPIAPKRMTLSKSEKLIRPKPVDANPPKAEASPYKPNAARQKPELPRHKSEVSLHSSGRSSPSSAKRESGVTPDQVNELQEFALKAGLIRAKQFVAKADKYAQADPADFEIGARLDGKIVTPTSPNTVQRMRRSRSQPSIFDPIGSKGGQTPQRTTQRTAQQTPSGRTAQQSDRRIVVRGNPYLIRLLSYPDPALDDMEEVVKKLETELDSIEERLNKPSPSLSSSSSSPSPSSSSLPTPSTPTAPSTTSTTPTTPSTQSSLPPSFTRRTHKPSPLVSTCNNASPRNPPPARATKFWLAIFGAVLCLILAFVVGLGKLQLPSSQSSIM